MRVLLCGQKSFGLAALDMLLEAGHEVASVCVPAGGEDRLFIGAMRHNLAVIPSGTLNADFMPAGVDVIVAAHSHDFIGKRTRLKARIGAIGYHPSLLPRHRGRDAVKWTIKLGDPIAGGSVYWLSDNVDAGDIAAQDWCFVRPGMTTSELWSEQLFPMGVRLLKKAVSDLASGVMVSVPQDEDCATWEPSWERPPVRRPDLTMIGHGHGLKVVRERAVS